MMNPLGKHYEGTEALLAQWRRERGGPLALPTPAERDCDCDPRLTGCARGKCPRKRA